VDYATYRDTYFVDPPPAPLYPFVGSLGVTLYFADYDAAIAYYARVLGPPAYVEGDSTRGWPMGDGWLTLLRARSGSPRNVEITLPVATPAEAERLQRAFLEAGGEGPAPSDQLMYEPVRFCPVRDPFGTELVIISPLPDAQS
jgi:hypothetical protein